MGWTRVVSALGGAAWRPARQFGAAVDLTRSAGIRYAWQRWREEAARPRVSREARTDAYRAIWREAAAELGVEMRELPGGVFEFTGPNGDVRFQHGHVPIDSDAAMAAAFDKPGHYTLLRDGGIAVPEHLEFPFTDPAAAFAFLERANEPCVVKPARGTGAGSGVTTGVRTRGDLLRARLRASRSDEDLLIERQGDGDVYRVMVLDGEVLDVIRRYPPSLTGDGRLTVRELIAAENRRRLGGGPLERIKLLRVDLDCVLALERQGLSMRSTPAAGRRFVVKLVINQNSPGDNQTVREPLAPALHAEIVEAARLVGIRFAGVDLITADIDKPLAAGGGVIIEVNADPAMHHHYAVADPDRATRVAVPVLRRLVLASGAAPTTSVRPR